MKFHINYKEFIDMELIIKKSYNNSIYKNYINTNLEIETHFYDSYVIFDDKCKKFEQIWNGTNIQLLTYMKKYKSLIDESYDNILTSYESCFYFLCKYKLGLSTTKDLLKENLKLLGISYE